MKSPITNEPMTAREASEFVSRVEREIKDCFRRMAKAVKQKEDCEQYLEIEIRENKKLGNNDTANNLARGHLQNAISEVVRIRRHITKLENYVKALQ